MSSQKTKSKNTILSAFVIILLLLPQAKVWADTFLYGDVSGDGEISLYDATLTAQAAVGLISLTPEQTKAAEVSGDGEITAYDAALIAQYAVGLIDKFPAVNWKLVNNGNPIQGYDDYEDASGFDFVDSIVINDSLYYFFDSKTLGKLLGRYHNNSWEFLTDNGWSSDYNAIPKPTSVFDKPGKMKLYEKNGNIIGVYQESGGLRIGSGGLDFHGFPVSFKFDTENLKFYRWYSGLNYSEDKISGVIKSSFQGINSSFAYNGTDGILIGTYGGNGTNYRLTAAKYDADATDSYWKLWNGSGWGIDGKNWRNYTQIPTNNWSDDDDYDSTDPEISYIGNNQYLLLFRQETSDRYPIVVVDGNNVTVTYTTDTTTAAVLFNESENVWRWWNGSGWQTGGDYNYAGIYNGAENGAKKTIIAKENYALIYLVPNGPTVIVPGFTSELYERVYNYTNMNFSNPILITQNFDSYTIKNNENEVWLAYSDKSNIFIMKRNENWSQPKVIYSGNNLKVLDVNFINNTPIIFFSENGSLYAISDTSSGFWKQEKYSLRAQKPNPVILDQNKISFVEKWANHASAGNLGLDDEGFLYIPCFSNYGITIYNTSNLSQLVASWGMSFSYIPHASGVDIDDVNGKVYVTDRILEADGACAGGFVGRIAIFDKAQRNQNISTSGTLVYHDFNLAGDVAIDEIRGYLYVSDTLNNRIQKFNLDTNGNPVFSQYITGLHLPQGIDTDNLGNLYIVNSGNHEIKKLDSNGNEILSFGRLGTGEGEFIYPYGIAFDKKTNHIYVTDPFKKEIQVFDSSGNFILRFGSWMEGQEEIKIDTLQGIVADNNVVYASVDDNMVKFNAGGLE